MSAMTPHEPFRVTSEPLPVDCVNASAMMPSVTAMRPTR